MELLYFFSVFFRNIKAILVASIIVALLSAATALWILPVEYKTTITFSTTMRVDQGATAEKYDPLSYIEASDRFAEAILGWFRNPIIFEEIQNRVQDRAGVHLQKVMKIRKQEKQNLNIIFNTPRQEQAGEFRKATMDYLRERVANINEISNTRLELVNESFQIEQTKQSPLLFGAVGLLAGLFIFGVFFFIYEASRGKISFKDQAEEALGMPIFFSLRKKKDAIYLAEAIARKEGVTVILDTKKKNIEIFKGVVNYLSSFLGKKTVVVDGIPTTNYLTEKFGLSDLMSRVKGFFDVVQSEDITKLPMLLSKDQPNLWFWGAGQGKTPNLAALPVLASSFTHTILYTTIQEGIYTFATENTHFVVIIELGVTNIADLKLLRSFAGDRVTAFLVK